MTNLRLRRPDERTTLDPIPFPDMTRFARGDEPRPADLKLVEQIDDAFARVQADLDEVAAEIDRPFHFPGTDDLPPSAA